MTIPKSIRFGIPTRPLVERIMAAFPARANTQISHAEIAQVAQIEPGSSRFFSVTGSWRKRVEREQGLRIASEGRLFLILDAEQSLSRAASDIESIGRRSRKVVVRADIINPNDLKSEQSKERHRVLSRVSRALADQTSEARREIAGPKPVTGAAVRLVGEHR